MNSFLGAVAPARSFAAALVFLALFLPCVSQTRADDKSYDDAMHSVAWIMVPLQGQDYDKDCRLGAAVVRDVRQRLLVASCQTVGDHDTVLAIFPTFDAKGHLIPQSAEALKAWVPFGVKGKVVARNTASDLVLIQLPAIPKGFAPLKCAATQTAPQMICTVGISRADDPVLGHPASGILLEYSKNHAFTIVNARTGIDHPQAVHCAMLEVELAGNDACIGAPVLNAAGEMVGLLSGQDPTQPTMSYAIDPVEIAALERDQTLAEFLKLRPKPRPPVNPRLVAPMPPTLPPFMAVLAWAKLHWFKTTIAVICGGIVLKWLNEK
ncbi:MAG TPA: hypothetical protein VFE47_29115 [Tepidisphaeraceae bacterium]|jgi:hypothetical protein|nr:hypothetical protein [Tepidisphaeraceae bacterium]